MKGGDLSIRPMFNILFHISIFQNLCYVFIMGLIQCVKQFGYSADFKTHGYVWV